MVRLLVIDFDSFFPDKGDAPDAKDWALYDWNHKETPLFIETLWPSRAQAFILNDLPLPMLTGEQRTFCDRFRFAPDTAIYTAESNASAVHASVFNGVDEVWLYDAHHDAGYYNRALRGQAARSEIDRLLAAGRWHCDNWMVLYWAVGAKLHVRYPAWKKWALDADRGFLVPGRDLDRQIDDGRPNPNRFDRVFVCRSGAWVPSWVDDEWQMFVSKAAEYGTVIELDPTPTRAFNLDDVVRETEQWRAMLRETRRESVQS